MRSDDCPDQGTLRGFVLGKLTGEQIDSVAQHLESCPGCQTAVDELDEIPDALMSQLAASASPSPFAGEAELGRALAWAASVVECASPGDGPPGTPAPPVRARGTRLGEYRLLEQVGRGGMGTVYKALHTQMRRVVAIKVLPRGQREDERAVERFQREIAVVARLDHPNIVRAYDAREAGGERFLVTEYVTGWDLSELVRCCGPLPIADACEIVRQAAIALQHVHEHGLIHRDVKPSNLMLDESARVKLLDLGLAFVPGHGDELTDPGQLMGTLNYMAPEQATNSHDVDIRADVYGLGATLYRLLCGEAPLAGVEYGTPVEKVAALKNGAVTPIGQRRPEVSDSLSAVLHRALATRPEQRYGTPADLAGALEPFCRGCDLPALLRNAASQLKSLEGRNESLISTSRLAHAPSRQTRRSARRSTAHRASRIRSRLTRRVVLMAAAFAMILLLAAVTIRIRRGDQEFAVRVPDESHVQIDVAQDGRVMIDVTHQEKAAGTLGRPAGSDLAGWRRHRYDLGGTSFYPLPTRTRTSNRLERVAWRPEHLLARISGVVSADLDGDGYLELVLRDGNTIVAFDRWGKELWRRDPVVDSKVAVPVGRVGFAADPELADCDNDGESEVVALAGSLVPEGWTHKAPQRAVIYDGDGAVLRAFEIIESAHAEPQKCFDFNRDGHMDVVLTTGAYRQPHAICLYDYLTGAESLRIDFVDACGVAGVGDVNGDGHLELFLLQTYASGVDPPVGDYDSKRCYATLYDLRGNRLWQRRYPNALAGCLADLDADQVPEILLIHDLAERGKLYFLDPHTGAIERSFDELSGPSGRCWSVADVTGDHRKEFLVADGKTLLVINGNGERVASRPAPQMRVMATNDLNGDGHNEIVLRQQRNLVVLDGTLTELDRHRAAGTVREAIISDLDGDGVNEIIILAGDGEKRGLEVVHFAARGPSETAPDLLQPSAAVRAFLAALPTDRDKALRYVSPECRPSVRQQLQRIEMPAIPETSEYGQAVRVNDARVSIEGHPAIHFTLRFSDDRWWITAITSDDHFDQD